MQMRLLNRRNHFLPWIPGCVLWLPFSVKGLVDQSGYGHHAHLVNSAQLSDGLYVPNAGSAPGDYAYCHSTPALSVGIFTISFWCKTSGTQMSNAGIMSKYLYFGSWYVRNTSDGKVALFNWTTACQRTEASWNDGNWHCLQFRRAAGGAVNIYFDGSKTNHTGNANDAGSTTGDLQLGREGNYDQRLRGYIDDMLLFNRALSDDEITSLRTNSPYKRG